MRGLIAIAILTSLALLGDTRANASDLEGSGWRGTWVDHNSGHVDRLRARFKQTRDGNYRANFSGTFYKVIPFFFSTKLNVVGHDENGQTLLVGQSRVMGFGRFTYDGSADANNFHANYSSWRWVGEFNLTR